MLNRHLRYCWQQIMSRATASNIIQLCTSQLSDSFLGGEGVKGLIMTLHWGFFIQLVSNDKVILVIEEREVNRNMFYLQAGLLSAGASESAWSTASPAAEAVAINS